VLDSDGGSAGAGGVGLRSGTLERPSRIGNIDSGEL
jgi:hypothetical protein